MLSAFDLSLSEAAHRSLQARGVDVMLAAGVTDCDGDGVSIDADRIEHRIIWTAGLMGPPAGDWLGIETDRSDRVKVVADLSAPRHPNILVVGNAAQALGLDGELVRGVGPVAKQQGR